MDTLQTGSLGFVLARRFKVNREIGDESKDCFLCVQSLPIQFLAVLALAIASRPGYAVIIRYLGTCPAFVIVMVYLGLIF
jgi:hypothetical protein